MTRFALLTTTLLFLCFFYLGCGPPNCKNDRDCPEQSFCGRNKSCTIQCVELRDCQQGESCTSRGRCIRSQLSPGTEPQKETTFTTESASTMKDAGVLPEPATPKEKNAECQEGDQQTCFQGEKRHQGIGECKLGRRICRAGVWSPCMDEGKPNKEVCDNKDNDCNGKVDDGITCECKSGHSRPCGSNIGACKKGTQSCVNNQWQECREQVKESKELCDGKDNDCDGQTDEGFALGTVCFVGIGECRATGKVVCSDNTSTIKCNAKPVQPSKEVCDEKDNDCDGSIDEDAGCICKLGATRSCGSTTGECKQGTQTCKQGRWLACSGQTKPATEVCDGKDNDCDGQTDETFVDLGKECSAGLGACKNTGSFVCKGDKTSVVCNAVPLQAKKEVCDGIDNNCDGKTDETFADLGKSCSVGTGSCLNHGTIICSPKKDSVVCDATPIQPTTEVCDGKDNDCDGQVDEDITKSCYSGSEHTNGKGTCQPGKATCSLGSWGTCVGEIPPTTEVCDGKDNDCDGEIDESLTQECGSDTGECKKGTRSCITGTWGSCIGQTPPSPEIKDGKDNNCDGNIDEDFVLPSFAASKELSPENQSFSGVLFSPDKKKFAVVYQEAIEVFDAQTHKKLNTILQGPGYFFGSLHSTNKVFFTKNSNVLVLFRSDGVHFYDSASGTLLSSVKAKGKKIDSIHVDENEKFLLTVEKEEKIITVWDFQTRKQIKTLYFTKIGAVHLAKDGKQLFVHNQTQYTEIDKYQTGTWTRYRMGSSYFDKKVRYEEIRLSNDQQYLYLVRGGAFEVRTMSGKMVKEIKSGSYPLFSPDGKFLYIAASYRDNGVAELWNLETRTLVSNLLKPDKFDSLNESKETFRIQEMLLSPDGTKLVIKRHKGYFDVWNAKTGKLIKAVAGKQSYGGEIFSPDSQFFAYTTTHKSVLVWDTKKWKVSQIIAEKDKNPSYVAFFPNGEKLLYATSNDNKKLWDIKNKKEIPLFAPKHHSNKVFVAFGAYGKNLYSKHTDATTLSTWNLQTNMYKNAVKVASVPIQSVVISPTDRICAVVEQGKKEIKLRDLSTGATIHTLKGHTEEPRNVTFSPDGTHLFSVDPDELVAKVWDVQTGKWLKDIKLEAGIIDSLIISPDGKTMAVDKWGTIQLISISTGHVIRKINTDSIFELHMRFSPDGSMLITTRGDYHKHDYSIKLWSTSTGNLIRTFSKHTKKVKGLVFFPDGKHFASASEDTSIIIWELATGKAIRTIQAHNSSVVSLSISPDGKTIASGSTNGGLKLWK